MKRGKNPGKGSACELNSISRAERSIPNPAIPNPAIPNTPLRSQGTGAAVGMGIKPPSSVGTALGIAEPEQQQEVPAACPAGFIHPQLPPSPHSP